MQDLFCSAQQNNDYSQHLTLLRIRVSLLLAAHLKPAACCPPEAYCTALQRALRGDSTTVRSITSLRGAAAVDLFSNTALSRAAHVRGHQQAGEMLRYFTRGKRSEVLMERSKISDMPPDHALRLI